MKSVKLHNRPNSPVDYHPARKLTMVKPEVARTYYEGKGKGRVRMYETTDGRQFIADAYDRNFKTAVVKMKPKHYKGVNPDRKRVY